MLVSRPLAGRYAFTKRIRGTQRTIIWLARDQVTAKTVVASVVPSARTAGLLPAVGLNHVHAAAILKIVENPDPAEIPAEEPVDADARVVVADHIDGRSLQQRLDAGPVATETAAEWIASAADALALLHRKGAVHGAVAPRALIVVRKEPAIIPVLTHLIVPPSGAYCSPERVTGGGPSDADDTWALTATLYTALSRRVPFQGASRTELARAIVAGTLRPIANVDAGLWDIILRGLTPKREDRLSTADGLRDALREWMEREGVQSLGDFAPVEAVVGPSEAPPAVGDLSLVAALEKPESDEARAPIVTEVNEPTFSEAPPADVDDVGAAANEPRAERAREAAGGAVAKRAAGGQGPPSTSPTTNKPVVAPALPKSPPAPAPEPKRRGNLASTLLLVAIASAAVGLGIWKLRSSTHHANEASPASAPKSAAAAPSAPADDTTFETVPATSASAAGNGAPVAVAAAAPASSGGVAMTAVSAAPADVTACVRRVLPEGALRIEKDVDVGYLCTKGDLWGIERKFNLAIAQHGQGPGMVLWAHLGRFDLAAIALVFQRCCPEGSPLATAVPKGACTSLPESVDDVRKNPTKENVDRYAEGVDCFISKGIRYPSDWWDRVGPKDARGYFDQLVGALRP